ncbi:Rid family detoxifying hydrolase [Pelistega sp. MC2]|uniref:Rid family detoxifying hydrolase n=1 Tax=Pelistega sp. MC2 TaxID=1720297 RepID=UPI0008D8E22B|nr:Rid family detoxifying hydrolase [Pelistega sp. MC2]
MTAKTIVHTDKAPAAIGPYSQAVVAEGGKNLYLSGQLGLDPATGALVSDNVEEQVRQAFSNLTEVINAAGGSLENIVKLTLFVTDLGNFGIVNSVMSELIPEPFPARSTVEVSGLPKGGLFEVEAIVVI